MDIRDQLLLLYVAGIPTIGYLMAKFTLKVWKHPGQYPRLGMMLFPFREREKKSVKSSGTQAKTIGTTISRFFLGEKITCTKHSPMAIVGA